MYCLRERIKSFQTKDIKHKIDQIWKQFELEMMEIKMKYHNASIRLTKIKKSANIKVLTLRCGQSSSKPHSVSRSITGATTLQSNLILFSKVEDMHDLQPSNSAWRDTSFYTSSQNTHTHNNDPWLQHCFCSKNEKLTRGEKVKHKNTRNNLHIHQQKYTNCSTSVNKKVGKL